MSSTSLGHESPKPGRHSLSLLGAIAGRLLLQSVRGTLLFLLLAMLVPLLAISGVHQYLVSSTTAPRS